MFCKKFILQTEIQLFCDPMLYGRISEGWKFLNLFLFFYSDDFSAFVATHINSAVGTHGHAGEIV